MVKDAIHQWARQLGCPAIKEPKNLIKGQERADNLISLPGGELLLCDVSIVQPSAPTHTNKGQQRLAVAEQAAVEKHRQYDRMAEQEGADFVPVIMEAFGGIHDAAVAFFRRLASLAEHDKYDSCPWNRREALIGITSAVAIAIQKGNLRAFDRVHLNNRQAGMTPYRPARQTSLAPVPQIRADHIENPPGGFGDVEDQPSLLSGQREVAPALRSRVLFGQDHRPAIPLSSASSHSAYNLSRTQNRSTRYLQHCRRVVSLFTSGFGRGRSTSIAAMRSRAFVLSRADRRRQARQWLNRNISRNQPSPVSAGVALVFPEDRQRAESRLSLDSADGISFGSDSNVVAAGHNRRAI
jgi:hypothetical protein